MSDELNVSLQSSMQSHPTFDANNCTGRHKRTGNFEKHNKNLRNSKIIIDRK